MFQKTNKKVVYFGWNTTLHAAIKCTKQYYYLKNWSIKTVEQDLDEKKISFCNFSNFLKSAADQEEAFGFSSKNRSTFWK